MSRMNITDTNAVIALISEAIDDSLGPDWTAFDAAHHVMQWLADAGLEIVPVPKRGTDCPSSPTGFHIVDSTMESGPKNCFHCERPM